MPPETAPTGDRSDTAIPISDVSWSVPRPRTLLYAQPGIVVTNEHFEVAGRRFAIADLQNLRTARGSYNRLWVSVAALAISFIVASVLTWSSVGSGVGGALAAAAAVTAVIAGVLRRSRPSAFELWSEYQGGTVHLFTSDDERQYGQVTRALLRAIEMDRLG